MKYPHYQEKPSADVPEVAEAMAYAEKKDRDSMLDPNYVGRRAVELTRGQAGKYYARHIQDTTCESLDTDEIRTMRDVPAEARPYVQQISIDEAKIQLDKHANTASDRVLEASLEEWRADSAKRAIVIEKINVRRLAIQVGLPTLGKRR